MGGSLKGKNGAVGPRRYVERGIEDELIERLEKHESVALVGLPGVGKSTTARRIVIKLQEKDYIPILIKPSGGEKPLELMCERFVDTDIPCIGVSERIGEEEFKLFIRMIACMGGMLENRSGIVKRLESEIKSIDRSLRWGRIAESVALEMTRSAVERTFREFLNSIRGFLDSLGLSKFIGECVRSAGEILTAGGVGVILAASAFPAPWLVGIAAIALTGVIGTTARSRLEKEMLEGILESIEAQKVVLVIDDLSTKGFGFRGEQPLLGKEAMKEVNSLLSRMLELGVKTVHVVRVDFEEWLEYRRNRVEWLAKHELANVRRSEQVVELFIPKPEVFAKIVRANAGDLDKTTIDKLYEASGGIPALALMIHKGGGQTLEEILSSHLKKMEALWPTFDHVADLEEKLGVAKDGKEAEELAEKLREAYELAVRNTYRAAKIAYEGLRRSNFSYAALVAQPFGVAEDELGEFCQRAEEYMRGRNLNRAWIPEDEEIVEVESERLAQKERKIYRLNELWAHLPPLILTLSYRDEELAREMAFTRKLLLEIVDKKAMEFGQINDRMIFSALRHIAWLSDIFGKPSLSEYLGKVGITGKWLTAQALSRGREALNLSPLHGIEFAPVASRLFSKSAKDEEVLLHAAVYLSALVDAIGTVSMPSVELMEKLLICEYLMAKLNEDPAVIAHRAIARAKTMKVLLKLHISAFRKIIYEECLSLIEKLNKKDSEKLYRIALAVAGLNLGGALLRIPEFEEEAETYLKSSVENAKKAGRIR